MAIDRETQEQLTNIQIQLDAFDARLEFAERRTQAIRYQNFVDNFLSGLTDISELGFIGSHLDWKEVAVPANPDSGFRRVFASIVTNKLSVLTSGGTTVNLEYGDADVDARLTSAGFQLNDNVRALFGTGSDVSILFNGTDLIIDPIYGGGTPNTVGDIIINVDGDSDHGALAFGAASGGDTRIYWSGTQFVLEFNSASGRSFIITNIGAGTAELSTDIISESTGAAGVTVDGVIVKDSGLTVAANIVMGDNSVTGIDTLTFNDQLGTIAGVQNQNLLDKTATESISGAYTHTVGMVVDGTADEEQLIVQAHSTQTGLVFVVEKSDQTNLFSVHPTGLITTLNGTWDGGGMDIASGDSYAINGTDVLTATVLGPGVVTASLTSNLVGLTVTGSADEVQLTLTGNSTQTSDIFVIQSATPTEQLALDNDGNLQIRKHFTAGSTASSSSLRIINAVDNIASTPAVGVFTQPAQTSTAFTNRDISGIKAVAVYAASGTASGRDCIGIDAEAQHKSSRPLLNLTAIRAFVHTESIGSGAVTNAVGIDIPAAEYESDIPANIRGIKIGDMTGSSFTGTSYGIDIEQFGQTSGTAYGIRVLCAVGGTVRPLWARSPSGTGTIESGVDGFFRIDDNIDASGPTDGFACMIYTPVTSSAQTGVDGAILRVGDAGQGASTSVTAANNNAIICGAMIDVQLSDNSKTGVVGAMLALFGQHDGGMAEPYSILESVSNSVGSINAFKSDTLIGGEAVDGGAYSPYPTVSGRLHVDQESTTGAKPALFLDQADVSEQCIIFSSSGSDIGINLFTVNVTGTPKMAWDESEDDFNFSAGVTVESREVNRYAYSVRGGR